MSWLTCVSPQQKLHPGSAGPSVVAPTVENAVTPSLTAIALAQLLLAGPVDAVIVKFTFERSKKMFPTAATLTRASVVAVFGTVIWAEPLLGTLAASVVGNVFPPSVESRIATFAQFTGDTS